jgi:DNA polymerase
VPVRASAGRVLELREIRDDIGDCTRCKLHKGRTNIVFGVGDPQARLMFIGEGPGADEDLKGEPFVGRAGQLLTQIIKAMGLTREQVYIANVVKCRPPENRNPEPDEIEQCSPFLRAQIASINPAVIVALGKFAAQTLLGVETPISRMRGQFHQMGPVPVMPTFHPSYLLRNPGAKREVWEDMKMVMARLANPPAADE